MRNRLSEVVRNGLHRRFLESPYAEIRRHDQGDLLNLLATSSWSIADACMSATRVLINLCSIVVFGAFLLGLSWRLTAVAAVGATALFLALHLLSGRARRLGAHTKEVNQSLAARTLVVLQGMRTIRAFALEAHYQAVFERASAEARATGLALGAAACADSSRNRGRLLRPALPDRRHGARRVASPSPRRSPASPCSTGCSRTCASWKAT